MASSGERGGDRAAPSTAAAAAEVPDKFAVPDKSAVLDALRAQLRARFAVLQQSALDAVAGATHEQAKPENQYDTRALEQSYLSAGQSARIAALRDLNGALHFYRPPEGALERVVAGALVHLEVEREGGEALPERWLLVVPFDVFEELEVGGVAVQVVGEDAPLARALRGAVEGDEVRFGAGAAARVYRVVCVR